MSCCGNKRKEWLNESKASVLNTEAGKVPSPPVAERPDKVFEYTGNYSLTITGAVSGKTYYFRQKGDKVKVVYDDSFSMMAERNLRVPHADLQVP